MRPKVSIVIPVYGVEKYIARCARSLFEQTLDDMEFVFVDDCTQDASIDVLQKVMLEYPERKRQVTIIHHDTNRGLPQARKSGVLAAKGDYIIHCDSDDWVHTDMYRLMYEKAKDENADVVVCDYCVHDGNRELKIVHGCQSTDVEKFKINLLFQKDSWSLCNKMFRKTSCYKDIIYPKGNMGEDMAICAQLILYCKKIAYVDKPLYYYYMNSDSISHNLTIDKVMRNFNAIRENTDIVLHAYSHINNKQIKNGLLYIQYNAKAHLFPIVHRKGYRRLFLNTYPNLFSKMIFSSGIPCECKLKYIWALMGFYPRKIG